ncbi:DMT family transporter [Paenibacillus sp. JNUCC31]|uniref:DMT family transporter n=1 Tax=Paenibacillus sp. JNUCC-31 TaxID=2777983 RepID=UPI0017820999|nr:DMT family transporter [Paenibacillus sp. JNUCC-31]QOS79501.1 DMT family transporter [Paenibacillus sp. JNUCC-31]
MLLSFKEQCSCLWLGTRTCTDCRNGQERSRITDRYIFKEASKGFRPFLVIGLIFEGIPSFAWPLVRIILWLGIINGSFAFSLWTWSQKYLRAYENSLINNLMLLEVAVLDILILHRKLSVAEALGLLIVGLNDQLLTAWSITDILIP